MKLSELIKILKDLQKIKGDCEILAFHHEGGNSNRAYPMDIDLKSFVSDGEKLIIGGYYK